MMQNNHPQNQNNGFILSHFIIPFDNKISFGIKIRYYSGAYRVKNHQNQMGHRKILWHHILLNQMTLLCYILINAGIFHKPDRLIINHIISNHIPYRE